MNWKSVVGSVAPTIATALGGPLAGVAVQAIAGALGLSDASEERIAAAIAQATPEDLLKIKQAEQQFVVKMRELDVNLEQLTVEDRKSARQAYVESKDRLVPVLALVIIGAFVGTVAGVLFGTLTVDSVLAGTLIGYLSAKAEQVIAFYFGSSVGSKKKDDALADIARMP